MNSTRIEPLSARRWRLLPVLDAMLTLELAKTVLSVLAVLVTIIVSRKFLSILSKAIEGDVAADTLFALLSLKMLGALITLLPAAQFLGLLMVFGRMYRDQEMSVLASSGVGFARIYRAAAWFVVPLVVASAYLALEVFPWSEAQAHNLVKQDEKTADLRGIKAGRFNEFSRGDVVLYAESVTEAGAMSKIFVQSRSGDKNGVTVADSGALEETDSGAHFVSLHNGLRYQGTPGKADYIISAFAQYSVRIDSDANGIDNGFKRESAVPTQQLWKSKSPRELAELQRRLAVPLGILFLAVLAVPISRSAPRSGAYGSVLTAFLIYMLYENFQRIAQGLLISGKITWWVSYGAVYLFMLLLIAGFLLRAIGWRWVWQVISGKGRP